MPLHARSEPKATSPLARLLSSLGSSFPGSARPSDPSLHECSLSLVGLHRLGDTALPPEGSGSPACFLGSLLTAGPLSVPRVPRLSVTPGLAARAPSWNFLFPARHMAVSLLSVCPRANIPSQRLSFLEAIPYHSFSFVSTVCPPPSLARILEAS